MTIIPQPFVAYTVSKSTQKHTHFTRNAGKRKLTSTQEESYSKDKKTMCSHYGGNCGATSIGIKYDSHGAHECCGRPNHICFNEPQNTDLFNPTIKFK